MAQRGRVTRLRVKVHHGYVSGREREGGWGVVLFQCSGSTSEDKSREVRKEQTGGGGLESGEVLRETKKRRADKMTGDRAFAST